MSTAIDRFRQRSLPVQLLTVGLVFLLLVLFVKSIRIALAVNSLLGYQEQVAALQEAGLRAIEPAEAEALVYGLRDDIVVLQRETAIFLPLGRLFGWVPKVGPILAAAPDLMDMADAGSAAAVFAYRGLAPIVPLMQDGGAAPGTSLLPAFVAAAADGRADLQQAALAMDRAVAARAAVGDISGMPYRVQELFNRFDPLLPAAQDGMRLLTVLPELMGQSEPRRYLLIAQNEDELRPSGGFISGAGVLTVQDGNIVAMEFQDANLIDDWANKPYPEAPAGLNRFMGIDMFLFRDANYWPDFPTTAEATMNMFTYGQDVPLDGVIAVDQEFVSMILGPVGPVYVPELESTVSSGNVITMLRASWNRPEGQNIDEWIYERKAFIGPLAASIRTRLETEPGSIDPLFLVTTIQQAVDQSHLQIYMRDPAVAQVLAEIGWDGRLRNQAGQDLLMFVDTNVGYSKTNVLITHELTYEVALDANGGGLATATIDYTHSGEPTAEGCVQGELYFEDTTYESLINECYWNYLRLYTPAGSQLLEAAHHEAPASAFLTDQAWTGSAEQIEDPTGLAVFANFFLLRHQQSLTTYFQYELPPGTAQNTGGRDWQYNLVIYKQAGMGQVPATIIITLPENARLSAAPAGAAVDGQTITIHDELLEDIFLTLTYSLRS